jgi:hypothetical protein
LQLWIDEGVMNLLRPLILITPCIIPWLLWTCLRISYPRSYHAIIRKWKIKYLKWYFPAHPPFLKTQDHEKKNHYSLNALTKPIRKSNTRMPYSFWPRSPPPARSSKTVPTTLSHRAYSTPETSFYDTIGPRPRSKSKFPSTMARFIDTSVSHSLVFAGVKKKKKRTNESVLANRLLSRRLINFTTVWIAP